MMIIEHAKSIGLEGKVREFTSSTLDTTKPLLAVLTLLIHSTNQIALKRRAGGEILYVLKFTRASP